jgi:uncharacterized protein YbjT (DUF2867 family)
VARRLGRLLTARGDTVIGIVRNADHDPDVAADGVEPVLLDLERASVDDIAAVVVDSDAVVFAAGASPDSTVERKDAVDRAAAILLADAAGEAAIRPYLLMSSIGVDEVANGRRPEGVDDVSLAYLRSKWAAEEGVRCRPVVDLTVVRPGRLTEEAGSGLVELGRHLRAGSVPRDDVAAVLLALLDSPRPGAVIEMISGSTPIDRAVAALR